MSGYALVVFSKKSRNLIIEAGELIGWDKVNPDILGSMLQAVASEDKRSHLGMHYTSVPNIMKVINPLFLDDLKTEFNEIQKIKVEITKKRKLSEFQNKLANLTFLDPACGSGNFLTETYISLRRLENDILRSFTSQISMADFENPIKVSISQFYGIEINDFAVTVAKTALWIAESQMMKETEDILHMQLDFLPLKSYANITEGNALQMDWASVIPKHRLNYIMGNPPFVGGMYMSPKQKKEILDIFNDLKGSGELDYVTGWYKKSIEYSLGTNICCAFVSTNSICQGSQVITFWKYIIQKYNIHIDFAYPTFIWNNESKSQAKVHCVIVGFSGFNVKGKVKKIFYNENSYKICETINPYLTDAPIIFIESRNKPICNVPSMKFGSMPRDGGGFILTSEEREYLIKNEPLSEKWIKPYVGAVEFLNNKKRYCLWLVNADPSEINKCATIKKRIELVRNTRLASKAAGTRKFAETPTLFCQIAQPNSDYIIIPKTSSGKRKYIPIGFMDKDTIASDLVFLIPNATLYEFGVLTSNVHNAWMRLVCGRLKSDYRYSKDIVYNNFPWCTPTDKQKAKIEQTAQAILDARALYPNSSLSELYKETIMPKELITAHQNNDKAVMQAYGITSKSEAFTSPSACVAELMKMYQKLVSDLKY